MACLISLNVFHILKILHEIRIFVQKEVQVHVLS